MSYKYIANNNLYEKQTYMYSEYKGMDFLKEYLDSRKVCLNSQENPGEDVLVQYETLNNPVQQDLLKIVQKLNNGNCSKELMTYVNAYTKSFEVRKRLYSCYDDNWKPTTDAGFEDYESYLLFAECLLLAYRHTECLKYFSCLLKVDDTLLSIQEKLRDQLKKHCCRIIQQEVNIFYQLAREHEICWEKAI